MVTEGRIPRVFMRARRVHTVPYMSFCRWVLGLGCTMTLSMTAVACGGAVDGAAGDEDDATGTWSAMLTCDDGDAVLEVDRSDATQLMLVVRGEEARRHLTLHVDRAANSVGEIVVVGRARVAVESAASFDRFADESNRYERSSAIGLNDVAGKPRIVAEVRRSAVDQVTLAFQEVTTTRSCAGTVESHYCRGAEWIEQRGIKELASWSFKGCH
jgi:hypothetical protein